MAIRAPVALQVTWWFPLARVLQPSTANPHDHCRVRSLSMLQLRQEWINASPHHLRPRNAAPGTLHPTHFASICLSPPPLLPSENSSSDRLSIPPSCLLPLRTEVHPTAVALASRPRAMELCTVGVIVNPLAAALAL